MVGPAPEDPRIGERYNCERAPVVKGTVVLVEVSRLPGETRKPKKLWMWWAGGGEPNLDLIWKSYCRRFSLEHGIKFMKLTLGWTAPRVRHPEQADRWTWLILAAYTQLRLARSIVADRRLPWGEAAFSETTDPDEGVEGILRPSAGSGYTCECAETPRALTRQAERQPLWSGEALPGHKEGRLTPI